MTNFVKILYELALYKHWITISTKKSKLSLVSILLGDFTVKFDGNEINCRVIYGICREQNIEVCVI